MSDHRRHFEAPGWVGALLVRSWNDGEAVIIRQLLLSYGIPCQVVSEVPHSILPFSVCGLGEIRIMVSPSRLSEAADLLAEHRRFGYRLVRGGKSDRRRERPREVQGRSGC